MKSVSTYTKYRIGCAYVGEFLQSHYRVKDIALKELSLPFITNYETFLRIDKQLKINSAMVFVRNLRAMIFGRLITSGSSKTLSDDTSTKRGNNKGDSDKRRNSPVDGNSYHQKAYGVGA